MTDNQKQSPIADKVFQERDARDFTPQHAAQAARSISREKDRREAMTDEEKQKEDLTRENRKNIAEAMNNFFDRSLNAIQRPMYALCIPSVLANDNITGSNYGLRLILAKDLLDSVAVKEFTSRLEEIQIPKFADLVQMLNRNNLCPRSVAECFWLKEMCSSLGFGDQYFNQAIGELLYSKESNLEEIDFTGGYSFAFGMDKKYYPLQHAAQVQYKALESILQRM